MKIQLIFSLLLFNFTIALSQDCPESNVSFKYQEEIDEFIAEYPNCTEIKGDLRIGRSNFSSIVSTISDLSPLSSITHIEGDLIIYNNPSLTTLDGLQNLVHVGEDLEIENNEILSNVNAINQIETIGENLDFFNNPVLFSIGVFSKIDSIQTSLLLIDIPITSLDAFPNLIYAGLVSINRTNIVEIDGLNKLTAVQNDVRITSNKLAENLSGFDMLTEIGGILRISSNDTLESLSGFPILEAVHENLEIRTNDNLKSITTFENLSSIGDDLIVDNNSDLISFANSFTNLDSVAGNLTFEQNASSTTLPNFAQLQKCGDLEIIGNDLLSSISGLTNLTNLLGKIDIQNNATLTTLDGLDNIDPNLVTSLRLNNNPNLSTCNIQSICPILYRNITKSINNNSSGCGSYTDLYYNSCRNHECTTNGEQFLRQEQIDSFEINEPYCTYLVGDVIIGDITNTEGSTVINLDGLSVLDTIIGDLYINNNSLLESTEGVELSDFFEGAIHVENNQNLTQLDLFKKMTNCTGDIDIRNNASLEEVEGVYAIRNVAGSITILSNPKLKEAVRFLNLKTIGGSLTIQNHPQLFAKMVFEDLETIHGDFTYTNNNSGITKSSPPMTIYGDLSLIDNTNWYNNSLCGIDTVWGNFKYINNEGKQSIDPSNLRFVGGDLIIEDNSNVSFLEFDSGPLSAIHGDLIIRNNGLRYNALEGLISLRNIKGELEISNSKDLETLEGLQALSAEGISSITVRDNVNLNFCSVQSICTAFAADTIDVVISGNDSLCINNEVVETECSLEECWTGTVVFRKQSDINDFAIQNTYCTVIDGDLIIEGDEVKNLYALKNIELIKGNLEVPTGAATGPKANGLISFEGLQSLRVIEGDLRIAFNDFPDFTGLENLERIEGEILLHSGVIESFKGLDKLQSVERIRILFGYETLASLQGLEGLDTIRDGFTLTKDTKINSLEGIQNVKNFSGALAIAGLHLTDITAINNWPAATTESINLYNCPVVELCSIKYICEFAKLKPEKLTLSNKNNLGCQLVDDLDCSAYGITGTVFFDSNENGEQDINELGVSNIGINISPSPGTPITNAQGEYFQFTDSGEVYVVTLEPNSDWVITSPIITHEITFHPDSTKPIDFGIYPTFSNHNALLALTAENNRCNEEGKYHIKIQNTGTHIETGYTTLMLDPLVEFIESDISPSSYDEDTNTLQWEYDELFPYQKINIELTVQMPDQNSTNALLQNVLEHYATIDDEIVLIEDITNETLVRCAYDPNDKQVSPIGQGEEAYVLKDQPLTYTIRFQNTGNDYAKDIRLTDTIAPQFDIRSLVLLDSSHEVYMSINGREVTFFYDNIFLLDSTTNEPLSHGFVSFRINLLEDVEDFTLIQNSADIYFDFNPPIRTNTTSNIAVENFSTSTKDVVEEIFIVAKPNPMTHNVSINSSAPGYLGIYNSQMNKMIEWRTITSGTIHHFNTTNWPSGLYFITLKNSNHQYAVRKIIKI